MSTTTTKKPTIDFSQWTQGEEQKPRTLREIEREVGFPFEARAVAPAKRDPSDTLGPAPVGTVVQFTGPSPIYSDSFNSDIKTSAALPLAVQADVPRWILMGAK